MIRRKFIVLLGVLFSLIACKTRQIAFTDTIPPPPPHIEPIAKDLDNTKQKQLSYNWISYRANASLSAIDLKNLNLFVVNRKDSIIYMTASKLGIEGGRLVLTPDSVKILNHLQSNYYVGDYSIVEQLIGLKTDFYMVQSLLIGEELPEHTKSFIQVSYGNFTTIDSQPFFQQADFFIPKENLQIDIRIKSIKLNETGPTSIRVPEKYTRIK